MSRPYVCTKCLTEWDTPMPCQFVNCPANGQGHVVLVEVLEENLGKDWREKLIRHNTEKPAPPPKKHDLPPPPKHLTIKSFIGKKVGLIPLTQEAVRWAKRNKGKKNTDWSLVTLLKWEAEFTTVRAGNGKRRTFGPQEATWCEIRTTEMIVEDTIKLVQGCIADYVENRYSESIAAEIRAGAWKGDTRSDARAFQASLPRDRQAFFPNG